MGPAGRFGERLGAAGGALLVVALAMAGAGSGPARASAGSPAAAEPIAGIYRAADGYVEITIAPCGPALCGDITRIAKAEAGKPDRDVHNRNRALRGRPLVGVRVLENLRWDQGAWRGRVYNPEDGGTYRAVVRRADHGAIRVQGCLAIACRTRIWPPA